MTFEPIPHRVEAMVTAAIEQAEQDGVFPDAEYPAIPVQRSKRADQGQYSVPCMAFAKAFKMKPIDIANAIAERLPDNELIDHAAVAPPGFLNFYMSEDWIVNQLNTIINADQTTLFQQDVGQGRLANVEFLSANPTGPLHVGRTRGAIVGDSIGRLLEACGWKVHREYYFNNGGRQMEMLGDSLRVRYLQQLGQGVELEEDHYQGDYLADMAKSLIEKHGDSWKDKDWQPFKDYAEAEIFDMIEATLARIGIKFDLFFNELDVYKDNSVWEVRDQLEKRGHTYQAAMWDGASEEKIQEAKDKGFEPATWFRATSFGDNEDRIIVRSNGEPTYVLPDVAYHVNKIRREFDRLIDIFGSDHFIEAQTVDRALQALGYDTSNIDVVLTQWVHLIRGGEKVSMSTRKGQYITLDELIDEVGSDVIRYFMLDRSTDREINFDLELAVKQSNENPVYYIQNAHVRCAGIMRQVEARGYPDDWDEGADLSLLNEEEHEFILKMLEFPDILLHAYDNLAPHLIATYALDLARQFHPMYERSRVLGEDVSEDVARARLRLYRAARWDFQRVLTVMGMSAPDTM